MYSNLKKIYLIDFGCAQQEGVTNSDASYFGIYNHLPPEYINQKYIKKVDIWGIGIIIYYLLFQTMPYNFNQEIFTKKIDYEKLTNNYIKQNKDIENTPFHRGIFIEILGNLLNTDYEKRMDFDDLLCILEDLISDE
jgi:serine/threonine protein kinase